MLFYDSFFMFGLEYVISLGSLGLKNRNYAIMVSIRICISIVKFISVISHQRASCYAVYLDIW